MFDSYVLAKKALKQIHNHSFKNRAEIAQSLICYCIHCQKACASGQVEKWVDDGETAICPKCGVDSLIGSAAEYEMTEPLLKELHEFYFEQLFVGRDFDYSLLEPIPE